MLTNILFAEAASSGTTAAGGGISTIIMLVAFIAIFYFMIYRPQKKQEKETTKMRDNLQVGDEISTNGGILGRVVKIKDDIVCNLIKPGPGRENFLQIAPVCLQFCLGSGS